MTYVKPPELATTLIEVGETKMRLSVRDTLIRAYMGGALLTLAAAFAVKVTVDTGQPLIGALLFPIGFCLLYLLGYDLLTGVFVLAPLAWLARRPAMRFGAVLRNWGLVFLGNLAGAVTVAFLVTIFVTYGFDTSIDDAGNQFAAYGHKLAAIGTDRTLGYADHGAGGWLAVFVRGIMCNWMVSTAVVGAYVAKDVIGKVVVMWLPVMLFFAMGFEHSVVNMFLFPVGLMLGADFTLTDYLLWNELPTVLGNLVGGLLFTGLAIYATYYRTAPTRITPAEASRTEDLEVVAPETVESPVVAAADTERVGPEVVGTDR